MIHAVGGAARRHPTRVRRRRRRLGASLLLIGAVLASSLAATTAGASPAGQHRAAAASSRPPRPSNGKLTPRLAGIDSGNQRARTVRGAPAVNTPDDQPGGLQRSKDGGVVVDLRVADVGTGTQHAIRGAGAKVLAVSPPDLHTITALVNPADLDRLAALPSVKSVEEALRPQSHTACAAAPSSFTSEGDAAHHADTARTSYNVDGTGVRVGVMSDSYNTSPRALDTRAADDVTNGDLPGAGNPCGHTTPVVVTNDGAPVNVPSGTPTDEGRAMAQTVHDLAPGATLDFASAFVSETSFATNIGQLVTNGARVIVDDVTYFDEPFYQDGPVSAAVNSATAAGVSYFSSAANNNIYQGGQAVGSYEATSYRATTCPTLPFAYGDCQDFDPGAGTDTGYGVTVANNGTLALDLQWAQPWNNVTSDYDLFVLNSSGTVLAQSTNNNGTTQKPFEFIRWNNTTGSSQAVRVVVARLSGSGVRFKLITLGNSSSGLSAFEYTTSTGTDNIGPSIFGHNGAEHAFSVAAAPYSNLNQAEGFSSHGPVTILFQPVPSTAALGSPQVLNKPDFTAVDCVQNSFFGGGTPHRFCGTSDAAPHAAAIAALVQQARSDRGQPLLTPAQMGTLLRDTAVPVGTEPALVVGAGLLDADRAVGTTIGATTTTLSSSANPSVVGQTVTYTATVSPKTGPAISVGTVNFAEGGTSLPGCAARAVSAGTATCSIAYPHPGVHDIKAGYSGNTGPPTYLGSTSNTLVQVVNKAPTTTTLTSAPNPSTFGQSVTFTAHVAVPPPGAGLPTGTVTFKIGANPVYATPLNSATGLATFTTAAIGPPGAQVTAEYSGDDDFLASTSNTVDQVVVCDRTISGTVGSVAAGSGSTCLLNAHVTGSVTTTAAGSLAVINSTVDGSIVDNTGAALRVCGTTVGNGISAQNAQGLVVVGDPLIGCAGNQVGGSMSFVNDHAGLMVIGNTYHVALVVINASGAGPLPGDTGPVVSGNTKV